MMISVFKGDKLIARVNAESEEAAIKRVAERESIPKEELTAHLMTPDEGIKHA